jgi:hypothetical protein
VPFKRIVALLAVVLGLIGTAACLAGGYAVWRLGARLEQANDRAFAVLDRRLATAQDRVRGVQERVRESRLTAARILDRLRERAGDQVNERLASRLDIDARADTLAGHLRTADLWLETATESVRGVRELLELGDLVGAPAYSTAVDDAAAQLAALRAKVLQAKQAVDQIREILTPAEGESEEGRFARVSNLLARILVTVGEIDTRLDECVNRLAEAQAAAGRWEARASRCIAWTTAGCYLVLAWVAAGQAALCVCGGKRIRRSRTLPTCLKPQGTQP